MALTTVMYFISCLTGFFSHTNISRTDSTFPLSLFLGTLTGLLYLSAFLLTKRNLTVNGLILPTLFGRLSIMGPVFLSVILFHEYPAFRQIIGIVLAVGAIVLFNSGYKNNDSHGTIKINLLLILFLNSCLTEIMPVLFERYCSDRNKDLYLFVTFFIPFVFSLITLIIKKKPIGKSEILFGTILGLISYFASKFQLLALDHISPLVVSPALNVGAIIITAAAGTLFFHERLTRTKIIGCITIIAALLFLSL